MIIGAGHFLVKLIYLANNKLIFITNNRYIVTCYRALVSFVVVCRAIERGGPGEVWVSRVKPEAAASHGFGVSVSSCRVQIGGLAVTKTKAGNGDNCAASRTPRCHQGQGVLVRGSVVQAIAFAGIRSGRAAARATAPAPTGKPTASRGQGPHGLLASQC